WHGGHVAREAKALVRSAALWAGADGGDDPAQAPIEKLLTGSIRSRDPSPAAPPGWTVRRPPPAPPKTRIARLGPALELELISLMGSEVANVHLATSEAAPRLLSDLDGRPAGWLRKAVRRMIARTLQDYSAWRRR